MSQLQLLTCPTCGAKLKAETANPLLRCEYCHNQYAAKQEHGMTRLAATVATDKNTAELAIIRLQKDLTVIGTQINQLAEQTLVTVPPSKNEKRFLFFLYGSLAAGVLALFIQNGFALTLCAIAFFACFGLSLREHGKRRQQSEQQKEADLAALQEQYDRRIELLSKNVRIANSP